MVNGDHVVVRMFSHRPKTVRWETRIVEGRGLELTVLGPGTLERSYAFDNAPSLVEYQVRQQQQLLSSGYTLLGGDERRTGQERRHYHRLKMDRRSR